MRFEEQPLEADDDEGIVRETNELARDISLKLKIPFGEALFSLLETSEDLQQSYSEACESVSGSVKLNDSQTRYEDEQAEIEYGEAGVTLDKVVKAKMKQLSCSYAEALEHTSLSNPKLFGEWQDEATKF